jgi:subtilisin family serine protease
VIQTTFRNRLRPYRLAICACLLIALVLVCVAARKASATALPLSEADYGVSALCSTPPPGHAACFGLKLVARAPVSISPAQALSQTKHPRITSPNHATPAFEHTSPQLESYSPEQLQKAYALPTTPIRPQTIAIVDAYNDLSAESDLKVYDQQFGLPECTVENGCFTKVNQTGEPGNLPFPQTQELREQDEAICESEPQAEACKQVNEADGWAIEIATDIEMAHGICHSCRIILVEAESSENTELNKAEQTAVNLGANEISDSWGSPEVPGEELPSFEHPGVVITAASGDNGYLDWAAKKTAERGRADFPASFPDVIAVGGTRLILNGSNTRQSETVWNGSGATGGGCSNLFTAQPWQQSVSDWSWVGCPGNLRASTDISADGDPYTGVAIYSSQPLEGETGWATLGGTSVASPIIASIFALAGGANGVPYPARTLYENQIKTPGSLYDIQNGSNGKCKKPPTPEGLSGCSQSEEASQCSAQAICLAGVGYDGPSGLGSPNGIGAFQFTGSGEGENSGPNPEAPATPTPPPAPPGNRSPGVVANPPSPTVLTLSGLTLTQNALIALNRPRPIVSRLGFAFTLSMATRVRITLAKQLKIHHHVRWKNLPGSLTVNAIKGQNRKHFTGHTHLTAGRYLLTVTPVGTSARSIVIVIG